MDLVNMYLALLYLLLYVCLEFLFVHHAPECFLNFLAGLHNLPFDETVVHPPVLLDFLQDRVLFVNTVQISIFNVPESSLPVTIHTLARLDLFLLNINYLSDVKNVIDPSLHVSYKLLRTLDLLIDGLSGEASYGRDRRGRGSRLWRLVKRRRYYLILLPLLVLGESIDRCLLGNGGYRHLNLS